MTHTADRFWQKVARKSDTDCWEWTGYRNKGKRSGECRYGRIDIFGFKGVYVHRVAYYLAYPKKIQLLRGNGLFVCHRCDNPICCNPRHLYLGDHNQNMRDKVERGRSDIWESSVKTPRAKLTEEDVRDIRAHKKAGATKKAIALLYDVSTSTISGVCYGRHYQDVH